MEKENRRKTLSWVPVFIGTRIQAQIVEGLLKSNGIPVRLEYEAIGKIYGLTAHRLGQAKVLVPREFYDEAQSLINE